EYMYWYNVETKPGVGYPREWEDNDKREGGWHLKDGKLELRDGGRVSKLLNIFYNQNLVQSDEYYELWTYDYENLVHSHKKDDHQPVERAISCSNGEYMAINGGRNWEDDRARDTETGKNEPNRRHLDARGKFEFGNTFMMYRPRSSEH